MRDLDDPRLGRPLGERVEQQHLVAHDCEIDDARTRRSLFASRPHIAVTLLAIGAATLTVALPFLPLGAWFEFVAPTWRYYVFLALVVVGPRLRGALPHPDILT